MFFLAKFWRVMSAKKDKLKIWYTTKTAQKKPLVIVLLLFLWWTLSLEGGKVKNKGTIFSLINYPINFILTLKNVDYQCANIISWLLFWKVKNTVDNLQNIIFWPMRYNFFENWSSELFLTKLIWFLTKLWTKLFSSEESCFYIIQITLAYLLKQNYIE